MKSLRLQAHPCKQRAVEEEESDREGHEADGDVEHQGELAHDCGEARCRAHSRGRRLASGRRLPPPSARNVVEQHLVRRDNLSW